MNLKKTAFYLVLIAAISYFFIKNSIDWGQLETIQWTKKVVASIAAAIAMLLLRDFGYAIRLKHLTGNSLNWKQTFRIIFLWEFGSAITPGMLGGKAVALFLLIKNGINAAKASSIILMAILLDEIVFLLIFPFLYLYFGNFMFQIHPDCPDWVALSSQFSFLSNIQYISQAVFSILVVMAIVVITITIGVFVKPQWILKLIDLLAKMPLLNKWESNFKDFGEDLIRTNTFFSHQSLTFWTKLIFYTLISWFGRYLVAVILVWGFSDWIQLPIFQIYAQQYSLWFMFYLPSTPGSSGLAEAIFMAYYCVYLPTGISGLVALIWRIISYYIYIIIGVFAIFYPYFSKIFVKIQK